MTKRSVVTSLAVVLALAIGFVGGWLAHQHPGSVSASSQPETAATGTVSGHLFAVGGLVNQTRPLSGVVFVSGRGNMFVPAGPGRFTGAVGSDGEYVVTVPAGRYSVTGRSPQFNGGRTTCFARGPVIVSEGAVVVANVVCPMK